MNGMNVTCLVQGISIFDMCHKHCSDTSCRFEGLSMHLIVGQETTVH